ncbi:hypothetical protein PG985_009503 [Apiospora marii]|uniref:uncharacterized protein n=1 Tax=Apiospora marii TaxID=335849 RepID=UPI00312E9BC3
MIKSIITMVDEVLHRILNEAFRDAKLKFKKELTHDHRKIDLVESKKCCQEVHDMAMAAMNQYSSSHSQSKVKLWLYSFAQKVTYYGGVLDVFVQHHPEYVALAWGAMKVLFTVSWPSYLLVSVLIELRVQSVVNHEKTISKLAKGLSLIADRLPRVELLAMLYPTAKMQDAIADLNAHILRFLVRAYDWYKERPWEHFLHSITRPPELRYDDLLGAISCSTENIKELASCGEQVKIHSVQQKLDQVSTRLDSIGDVDAKLEKIFQAQASIATSVSLQSSSMASTNYKLTDLQFSQIMRSISNTGILTPDKVLHYLQFQASRPRVIQASGPTLSRRFIHSPRLRKWDTCDTSAITLIRANFRCRQAIRSFCWDLVQQLRASKIWILFAIKIPLQETDTALVTCTDVLKYLIRQALQITQSLQTESSMSLTCTRFHSDLGEEELFQVLEAVLSDIPGSIYIFVDLELPSRDMTVPDGFSWLRAFLGFFDRLGKRKPTQHVKVMLLSYSSDLPFSLSDQEMADFVLRAKSDGRTAQQRRARKRAGNTKQGGRHGNPHASLHHQDESQHPLVGIRGPPLQHPYAASVPRFHPRSHPRIPFSLMAFLVRVTTEWWQRRNLAS